MRLQGAIFDMDGTLLDSMWMWYGLPKQMLKLIGVEQEDPQVEELMMSGGLMLSAEYLSRTYRPDLTAKEIAAMTDAYLTDFYTNRVEAKPDAEKFLSILKMEGVWMYVATNTERRLVEAALRHTGLDRYFRGIITCAEAGRGKEDPLIYEKALTRLRCLKRDVVVFEDAPYAIRTAKAAGFRVAMIREAAYGDTQVPLESQVDYLVESYTEWINSEQA